VFTPITPCPVADDFSIIVHSLYQAVANSLIKVSQDSLFMSSEHPGKVTQRLKPTMSSPPEPPFQILSCPGPTSILPESSEQLLKQVCLDDLQIHLE